MMKLLARNRRKGEFRSEADAGAESATLYLYDMIVDTDDEAEWWGGVSPQAFVSALNAIEAPTIHLRVNSPGGSVFAARAIEQAIREHKSQVIVHVDGLAASAASFLIMAADRIEMAPGSFLMIHKAWTIAWGNEDEMIKTAGLLKQIDGSLVKTYAARSGQPDDDIAAMMADETWIEAGRAVELGFADSVAEGDKPKALAGAWDLTAYQHAPRLQTSARQPAPQPDRDHLARAVEARIKQLSPA